MIEQTAPESPCRPIVSVIVPTVRLDDDFIAAVRSLQVQTLHAIEIIVVLDGVTGEPAVGVARDWKTIQRDARIRVVRHAKRRGTPAALNTGVTASTAELIGRLDADDLAEPDRFRRQAAEFDRLPNLVLLGSSARLIDENGDQIGSYTTPATGVDRILLRHNAFVHSSVVMRRDALQFVGGYDERCNRMQDYELWLRLAQVGAVGNLSDPLVSYRVHPGMHSRNTRAFGPAAAAIRASRLGLARHLGRSRVTQQAENALWTLAQVARSHRLRRPRYLKST